MMNLQHRVQINIADRSGQKKQVLGSKKVRLPQRLLNLIFGDFCEVLVLTPGTSVRNIEIHEMRGVRTMTNKFPSDADYGQAISASAAGFRFCLHEIRPSPFRF